MSDINTAELANKIEGIIEDLTAIHAALTGDEENQDGGDTKGTKSTANQFAKAMNKAFGN